MVNQKGFSVLIIPLILIFLITVGAALYFFVIPKKASPPSSATTLQPVVNLKAGYQNPFNQFSEESYQNPFKSLE